MLFTIIMNNSTKYIFRSLSFVVFLLSITSCSSDDNTEFSEVTKVALRDVGHQILLINQDSTSLVKPVMGLGELKYQLSFEEHVAIHPDSLVSIIKRSLQKADLPQHYITEVKQCEDNEVAYSYEMKLDVEKGIVPCGGRLLPKACYLISIRFTKQLGTTNNSLMYVFILLIFVLLTILIIFLKRKTNGSAKNNGDNYSPIGSYQFYPEQNKLVKAAVEINLSKKECELLEIFVANPNQIIKRDELEKRVWEDNGVVVGRSLDTYISKLRKKLKDDTSIKLTNIHGIGYKLELLNK